MVFPSSTPTTMSIPTSTIQTSFLPNTISYHHHQHYSIIRKIKKRPHHYLVPSPASKTVSCKATKQNLPPPPHPSNSINGNSNGSDSNIYPLFDRRDVLIGLGGSSLYGTAANLTGNHSFAQAAPIAAPDLNDCKEATITNSTERVPCCPPTTPKIIDFKPPKFSKIRYRPAAHLVNDDYVAKFTKALEYMKALPDDDPRSFMQQANVHCAYCNGAYNQPGFPYLESPIDVHACWLFFPFHRLYLHFYERILGKLIGDPNFAMPFWNWDAPAGMSMPAIYMNPNSTLYDANRNPKHLPPRLVDYNYNGTDQDSTYRDLITSNLNLMYKQVVCAKTPTLFHGKAYLAGKDNDPGAGSIERIPHNRVHRWSGDPANTNNEDLGNFYSAGRDPMFFALHGNVDRVWSIWKSLPGKKRKDFTTRDWLDASFVFYDENAQLVRCKVRDCLDTKALGYDYQRVDIPWLKAKSVPRKLAKIKGIEPKTGRADIKNTVTPNVTFPIVLDKIVRVEVPRPKKSRSKDEKEDEEEVLSLEGIELDKTAAVKFDVFINDEDDEVPIGPEDSEFAGSFTNVPHGMSGMKFKTSMSLPLTELLEDLDVDGDDSIVVTLVPQEGKSLVSIGSIKIEYIGE